MIAEQLLRALADGAPHSGEALAREFGVTCAAVWKQAAKLADWGIVVAAAPGVGYRLAQPLELLDAAALRAALAPGTAARLAGLEVFTEIGSTNRHLLDKPAPPAGKLAVCLAEFQHAGRGRRGRSWHAPLGGGLCLSLAWQFAALPPDLPALTLAVGVVVRRVLARVAHVDIALKWPNDLVWDERKLGGILLELAAEAHGGCHVVAGLGINVSLAPESLPSLSDWPRGAVDLATAAGAAPRRLALAAALTDALAELFADYVDGGFAPYRAEWRTADFLRGRRVALDEAGRRTEGTAVGIEHDGALVIETADGRRRRVISGDVSVRSA